MNKTAKLPLIMHNDNTSDDDVMAIFPAQIGWFILFPEECDADRVIFGVRRSPILAWVLRRNETIGPVDAFEGFISSSANYLLLSPCGMVISQAMSSWETEQDFLSAAVGCPVGAQPRDWWSNVPTLDSDVPTSAPPTPLKRK